jgi:hypothetical protein
VLILDLVHAGSMQLQRVKSPHILQPLVVLRPAQHCQQGHAAGHARAHLHSQLSSRATAAVLCRTACLPMVHTSADPYHQTSPLD